MSRRPPAAAKWLLSQFASDSDAFIGDLLEQYHAGRSRGWFWRQALWATLVIVARDIARHKLLALRALAIGFSVLFLLGRAEDWMLSAVRENVRGAIWIGERWFESGNWMPQVMWILLFSWVAGAGLASGWIVAFFHRGHQASMTCLFACVILLWQAATVSSRAVSMPLFVIFTLLLTVGILVGGLASGLRDRTPVQ